VGTPFAFCEESGLSRPAKQELLQTAACGEGDVLTDPLVSPTGFPFKVAFRRGSLSERGVYEARARTCDLGYLVHTYKRPDGSLGYRCPAEPVAAYVRKGGRLRDTMGRKCLCNGLLATIGFPQVRKAGYVEKTLVTAGDAFNRLSRFVAAAGLSYSAQDVISYLLGHA
jgi:nitronate monooxygenase